MVARRSARHERTRAINQARALILTGPDELRARFAGKRAARLAEAVAALRPRPGDAAGYSLRVALRELGRRVEFPGAQAERLDELPAGHRPRAGPAHPLRRGSGHRRAAAHRRRRPPGAAARRGRLGAHVRRRPDPRIVGEDPPAPAQPRREPRGQPRPVAHRDHPEGLPPQTRAYVQRRTAEGLPKTEIIRCLKRYAAREVYPSLRG